MRGGRQVSNSDRAIILNKVPRVISASCSWPRNKSASPQAGSLAFLAVRLSGAARMASASALHEILIKLRYGLVSAACWNSVFLTPSNTAVAYGVRLDLTLMLNIAHMQPLSVEYHALSISCAALSQSFYIFGGRMPVFRQFL